MKKGQQLGRMIKQITEVANNQDQHSSTPLSSNIIKMPELALVMANYFNSLSKYCISVYQGYTQKDRFDQRRTQRKEKTDRKGMQPPKKPVTAYILYYQQKVPSFQEKYPNYTISELTRLIAKEWSTLPEQEKKTYTDRAASDRKRYEAQKQQYKGHKPVNQEQSQSSANRSKEQSAEQSDGSSSLKKESIDNEDSYQSQSGA